MGDLCKLAQAMCSVDLADSHWTQVSCKQNDIFGYFRFRGDIMGLTNKPTPNAQELPRLPVPDLWTTIDRYLASLKAVLAPDLRADGSSEEGEGKRELNQQPEGRSSLSSDQIEANRRQFRMTQQLAKHFLLNEGPQLQRDLKEFANKSQNWATEYWLQDMYLSNPIPLPVNSNPFFMFPRQHFRTSNEMLMFATRIIQFSVDFKYRIDQQTLRQDYGSGHGKGKPLCMETYKNFFHSYRMPHDDMDRLLPQSRRSNHIVVASCNQFYILRLGQDPLPDPYRKDASSVLDESSIFDQLLRIYRISREHARRQLLPNGTSNNSAHLSAVGKLPKVGLFTTENRKVWAKWHKRLIHCNGDHNGKNKQQLLSSGSNSPNTNTESLRLIEDCLFVMCLDSLVHPPSPSQSGLDQVAEQKGTGKRQHGSLSRVEDDVEAATIILTGGGSDKFTANRWFDKFLQIIVGRDGICGINIEHSASEGITVLRFLQEFLDFIKANPLQPTIGDTNDNRKLSKVPETPGSGNDQFNFEPLDQEHPSGQTGSHQLMTACGVNSITSPAYVEPVSPSALLEESENITPLMWVLDKELEQAIEVAEEKVNKLVGNFSLQILRFESFGRQFIKSQSLSPDAFVQLALQLTFYKLHNCLVSTYESASLRQFRLGRVDNIRANTCEAYDWIQAMLSCRQAAGGGAKPEAVDWLGAEELFLVAMRKQVEILKYTITGTGPDNHLLALKQLANIRYDDELPDLFTDPSYAEFLNFRLSTSQLPNESGIIVGYGAVVPDGYGCSYNPCEECIIFCISSFADCPITSSSKFAQTLSQSLLEMRELCLGRSKRLN